MNLNALVEALTEMRRELNGARADLARVTGHYTTLSNQIEAMPDCPDCFGHGTESCLTSSGEVDECACGTCDGLGQVPTSVIKLRESLARVTAELADVRACKLQREGCDPNGYCCKCLACSSDESETYRHLAKSREEEAEAALAMELKHRQERDAARAQVCELQKVARAAVAVRNGTLGAVRGLDRAVLALPPSMLEEPSDG